MATNRRGFIGSLAGLLAGGLSLKAFANQRPMQQISESLAAHGQPAEAGLAVPVITPDVPNLPYQLKDGVKEYHLIAEPVKCEFLPGFVFDLWGYNGFAPGPTVEVRDGDRVRFIFENHLPEATTVHWHGIEVPIGMDGVPGVTQPLVPPGGTFVYEFTLHQNGTFFYHSHMPMQEMMGMIGFFIIHPKKAHQPQVDKDYAMMLQEWAILPNNTVPNSFSMEFNWLTINGKAGPATTPLIVKLGERVRIRFVNLGMDHHPMHIHGHQWFITGTEGGRVPQSAWYPNNTVLVGVAQARDVEFIANNPGDWMIHCHLPHHMMNHMVSMVGPITEMGSGMPAGLEMEAGMGIIENDHAISRELGPSLGRGMGLGATREKNISHMVGMNHMHDTGGPPLEERRKVPGFPQDMWMPMDDIVAKPETYGLMPTWSGAVMGMMTLVRVLPPNQYEMMLERIREARQPHRDAQGESPSGHVHD